MISLPELEKRFSHHVPNEDKLRRLEAIRAKAFELSVLINELCQESREKSLAQTNVEQAMFWADASIVRNDSVE